MSTTVRGPLAVAGLAGVLASPGSALADLVINRGFETGDFTG
jgi:hypothetical protein